MKMVFISYEMKEASSYLYGKSGTRLHGAGDLGIYILLYDRMTPVASTIHFASNSPRQDE
jgi:hypothetical protein